VYHFFIGDNSGNDSASGFLFDDLFKAYGNYLGGME
jgi:hypothetical protein